jgi:translation initiation factor 3 subunit G
MPTGDIAPTTQPSSQPAADSQAGKYVPMQLRGAGARPTYGQNDDNTLRVTNISEETTEADLGQLFRRFGRTTRIFLAKDHQTGLSRGFAFISYERRDEAQAAIDKLNGYGYDNLILHVEWAKPREQTEDSRRNR